MHSLNKALSLTARGFLRFKHDLSESVLSPITRTHPDTLAHSWRRDRTLPKKENQRLAGIREDGWQEAALTASCRFARAYRSRTNLITKHSSLDLFYQ
ncbi:hypothetical protein BWA55_21070 [Salmonella enterica]|nr:hypothetical protein [Salmonella enterica]EDT7791877.1 hypothetical protein [Salmonella enterica subsp. enterica serovar Horsham]